MVQSQFALSWESYKSNICSGFSSFQQNGELVDMTLAADGHLVKVHQVLIALASPYLKQLIVSVPSQHPVIFLNNVSHTTLSFILEYIYTGEVQVPAENLSNFMEASKALHIRGLETMIDSGNNVSKETTITESSLDNTPGVKKKSDQIMLPPNAKKIFVNLKESDSSAMIPVQKTSYGANADDDMHDYSERMDDTGPDYDDDDDYPQHRTIESSNNEYCIQKSSKTVAKDKLNTNLQFTVSIRGALQVILNRYIYNLHSTQSTGVKRWRCIDYRNKKCSAFVVTKGNVVMNRANPHNHSFHDKKILDKIEKNAVYSALDDVQDLPFVKDKNKNVPEDSEFVSIDSISN